MFTHTIIRSWQSAGASIAKSQDVSAGAEGGVDESIPASSTNLPVAFAADVSQIKSLYIVADGPLTLKTNSSTEPDNTITLAANDPFVWVTGDPALRDTAGTAITTDITGLYVTNADADNAVLLQIRMLVDPTV